MKGKGVRWRPGTGSGSLYELARIAAGSTTSRSPGRRRYRCSRLRRTRPFGCARETRSRRLLVDQDGQPLTASFFNGRLTVLTFVFTRCPVPDYCPLLSRRFSQIQAALATDGGRTRDVRLLSVTIDPIFDTPPVLKAYAQAVGADLSRWRFAGGDSAEITRLARAFSVVRRTQRRSARSHARDRSRRPHGTHRRDLARQRVEDERDPGCRTAAGSERTPLRDALIAGRPSSDISCRTRNFSLSG